MKNSVWLDLVNTGTPAAPALAERIRIDGRLLGSRRIGNALVLVTQHSPQLAVEAVPVGAPSSEREALIAKISAADVLPQLTRGSAAPEPLLAETDCLLQPGNASVGIEITSITVFDLGAPGTPRTSRCFVGGSEALYMSPTGLYLATTRYAYDQSAAGAGVLVPGVDRHPQVRDWRELRSTTAARARSAATSAGTCRRPRTA